MIISPRHLYYYSKLIAGKDPHLDTGGFIKDAVRVIKERGGVSEDVWPYKAKDLMSKPPIELEAAKHYKISKSYILNSVEEIKSALHEYGPVPAGMTIFRSSLQNENVAKNGFYPDPLPGEKILGAQAICIVGYDDDKKSIKFKNSWGEGWGDKGYGYISYDYVKLHVTDIWAIGLAPEM